MKKDSPIKELRVTTYKSVPTEIMSPIEKVVHALPTWMFPNYFGSDKLPLCPICRREMNITIAHGQYVETCSFIKTTSGFLSPIHTACYESIGMADTEVNHFAQSRSVLDDFKL